MTPRKKVLVIEDSILIARLIESGLTEKGFEVLVSCDGADGLKKVKEKDPDIIILDLILPGLPGEAVCKEIKQDEKTARIPIVMLTAKDTDVDRVVGRVVGADCYLTKPFRITELLEVIERLLRSR